MGRPYHDELTQLPRTYQWSMRQSTANFCAAISQSSCRPIVAVGSGGSAAAANFLADLHTHFSGYRSLSCTPLEFLRSDARLDDSSVWFLSAGGNNVDICRTIKHAIEREPAQLTLLCASSESRAAHLLRPVTADIIECDLPSGKDGFLATNSLAAFLILSARSYAELSGKYFPKQFEELIDAGVSMPGGFYSLERLVAPIIPREVWLVPFDPVLRPVATDLESRFSEAALGSIMLSDLRNFAHGRHHWLAKNGGTSAVLALSASTSRALAQKTLGLIPSSVPRAELSLSSDPLIAPIAGIFATMQIASFAGARKTIDPGRPGVPSFGSRLYRLSTAPAPLYHKSEHLQAIARKLHQPVHLLDVSAQCETWRNLLDNFLANIYRATIQAVVFDYDGTLVAVTERFEPPKDDIRQELIRLLEQGIRIGIATGRGKSVRHDLRKVIPNELWSRIIVGYYNGAEIAGLDLDLAPAADQEVDPTIAQCKTELENASPISELIRISVSRFQLSAQWIRPQLGWKLLDVVRPIIEDKYGTDVQIVSSGHSVDIIPKSISKLRLIEYLSDRYSVSLRSILAFGDQGLYPGNDHALLSHFPSLSVDQVSIDAGTCWRLSPPSIKGPRATLWYLSKLVPSMDEAGVCFKRGSLVK